MTSNMIQDGQPNVLDRIKAMRLQEEKAPACRNYLGPLVDIDASCREAMIEWCFTVVNSFDFSRESVGIATSILDRYLSSGKGKSTEALESRQVFQLATITSFYMAVKIFEPIQLGISMVIKICRGFYKKTDIFAMEQDILFSLDWRVCISATTPMEYVRQFLQMLPEWTNVADAIQEHAMKYMDCAIKDIYFSTCRASTVGVACLVGALNDVQTLSSLEKQVFMCQLNGKLDFELDSLEMKKVEHHLVSNNRCHEQKKQACTKFPQSSAVAVYEQPASPVNVMQR